MASLRTQTPAPILHYTPPWMHTTVGGRFSCTAPAGYPHTHLRTTLDNDLDPSYVGEVIAHEEAHHAGADDPSHTTREAFRVTSLCGLH